jgi:fructose-1,6-bisphosphatase/sedoheptulose 1,7-bisphosphatase-like protein
MLNKNKLKESERCFLEATQRAAIMAYPWIGRNNKNAADEATVVALGSSLESLPVIAKVVIGEGEKDEAPMLQPGTLLGQGNDYCIDIAVDPLECTTECSKGNNGSFSTVAITEAGGVLSVPGAYYMDKIVTSDRCKVSFDNSTLDNIRNIAQVYDCKVSQLRITVMDRPRNQKLIDELKENGVQVTLVNGGSIEEAIKCVIGRKHQHAYMGICGGPEGIIIASALKGLGGQIVGKFKFCTYDKASGEPIEMMDEIEKARKKGIDTDKEYCTDDFISGDTVFFASGITDSSLRPGVRKKEGKNKAGESNGLTHFIVYTMIVSNFGDRLRIVKNSYSFKD